MKRFISLFIAVIILTGGICGAVSAFEIVLPDVDFGEEEAVYEPGDVNGDGSIDNTDASMFSRILKGLSVSDSGEPDVDGDGSYTNTDLSTLKRILKGVI